MNISKIIVIKTLLVLISIILTCSPSQGLINPDNPYEWKDGSFNGVYNSNLADTKGKIEGYLKLGRNPYIGIFYGRFSNKEDLNGKFEGFFLKNKIYGRININNNLILNFCFYGSLVFINDTRFNAEISVYKIGKIFIDCNHSESFLPELTGLYGVGVERFFLTDENRYEEFTTDDPNDFREMVLQVWYPIDKNITLGKIDYMDNYTFSWLTARSPIPLFTIPDCAYKFVMPHAISEPDVYGDKELFPVLVFSPGYDGNLEIYTSLIEDLVSNGFVVASINHPYVSGITVFPDGRTIKASPVLSYSLSTIVGDVEYVLDFLSILNYSDGRFMGRFDLSRIGMFGHSFGGAATVICCYEDPRVKVGLTLDGVVYENFSFYEFNKPFMMMLAEASFTDYTYNYLWNALESDSFKVVIQGSTHYAFTDVGILLKHFLPFIPQEILGFGTIEPKRMVNITKSFELRFFEVYLKKYPLDYLIELDFIFEEADLEYKLI